MCQRCWPQFVDESVRQERERGVEVSSTQAIEELEHELNLRGIEALLGHARHDLVSSKGEGWGTDFGGRVRFYMRDHWGVYATYQTCTVDRLEKSRVLLLAGFSPLNKTHRRRQDTNN